MKKLKDLKKQMVFIKKEKIATNILDCIDNNTLFLEVGTGKIFLDLFDYNMDGIFKNLTSWKKFINKVDSDGVEFLIRRKYINKKELKFFKYAIKVGSDKYIEIDFKDLIFNFDFQYGWYKNQKFNEAGILDIYVNINIK